jgi:hypothetical protein
MGIGEFLGDAIRQMWGRVTTEGFMSPNGLISDGVFVTYEFAGIAAAQASQIAGAYTYYLDFNASRAVPTADEVRPASISSYLCIKY